VKTTLLLLLCALVQLSRAASNTSADALLAEAISLAGSGRLEEAESVLLKGKLAFDDDARFPIELAGIAWRKKDPAHAKVLLRRGIDLDPSNAYAAEFIGSLYLLDGNLFAAVKYWNRLRRPVLSDITFAPGPPLDAELTARIPAVSVGQVLTEDRLARTERNIDRLGIFSEPRFDLTPSANGDYSLVIRSAVRGSPVAGIAGRLLPLVRGLPFQQINLDWINIEQSAARLTSLWRWDSNKRRIGVSYRAPLRSGAYAVWTDLRNEKWDLNRVEISSGVTSVRSAALGGAIEFDLGGGTWTPSAHLSRHTFLNGGSQMWFANSTIWEIRNRFTLPRWRYPERRVHLDTSLTLRTGRVFSRASSRLIGAELDVAAHWLPQARGDIYAIRGRLRGAALSGRLPIDQLYTTAMERDNDLWLRGHAGTRNGRKGNAPMGTRFVSTQTEAARRIIQLPFLRIEAGPFLDLANIGGESALGSRGWLYDAGVQAVVTSLGGFRWTFVYGRDLRGGRDVFYTALSR
jgi:hypothetical protein